MDYAAGLAVFINLGVGPPSRPLRNPCASLRRLIFRRRRFRVWDYETLSGEIPTAACKYRWAFEILPSPGLEPTARWAPGRWSRFTPHHLIPTRLQGRRGWEEGGRNRRLLSQRGGGGFKLRPPPRQWATLTSAQPALEWVSGERWVP